MQLLCPLCQGSLVVTAAGGVCAAGHHFDRARQGYLNLLPVQKKRSVDPGDDKAMVAARRAFLDAGHYAPIAEGVRRLLGEHLTSRERPALLDVGCGEGYYTAALERAFAPAAGEWLGVDISKWAIRAAARRSRRITWLVASGARLPVPSGSLDGMTALFTLLEPAEYARALKNAAPLVVAMAAPDHLLTLREAIYAEVRNDAHDPTAGLDSHFMRLARKEVRIPLDLAGAAIPQLLAMTPHVWRTSPERQAKLATLPRLATEAVVHLSVFHPKG